MRSSLTGGKVALFLSAVVLGPPAAGMAQQEGATAPRVFFDCRGDQCYDTYYRTEIPWVLWVRDQADADVYVIMTSQEIGVRGREYLLDLEGRGANADFVLHVRYRALATDTERERLDGVALTLALALGQFAQHAGFRELVRVGPARSPEEGSPARIVAASQVDDPWDLWVFRISANGNYEGQSSRSEWRLNTNLNANRVTPTWKQSYSANFNRRGQRIEFDDRAPFEDTRYDWGVNWRVVYSLAEHFSLGASGNVGRSTSNNQDIWGQMNPAVEYSFFPYEEATRRSLTAFYEIGPVYRHYFDVTLFGKSAELRAEQALNISFSQRQPWGNARIELRGSTYLHDLSYNNLRLEGSLNFRIVRGLEVSTGASYERVRDQIYLSGEDLTPEERLLRLQQEQTDYRVRANFGLSYQFGSPFNNVVNNRM